MDDKTIFQEKILQIMKQVDMNASQFSAETGINISTLSQIVNGNNKASLDVLTKIKNRFDFINTEWLFLNKGDIDTQISDSRATDLFSSSSVNNSISTKSDVNFAPKTSTENKPKEEKTDAPTVQPQISPVFYEKPQKIKRVTVYFDDNSFQDLIIQN
jgi:transcriptional regulator with XRE-family HTH domain